MIQRLGQYLNRLTSVYLTTLPGNYTKRKLEILTTFFHGANGYMQSLGVEYWISYGTLLGYHRQKGILPHDIDLDFGATEEAFDLIWNNRDQLPKGIKLYNTSKNHRGPKLFFSYEGFDADIYFYEDKADKLVPFLISSIPADMEPVDKNAIYPLQEVDFLDQKTFIPNDPKGHLEQCYGYIGPNAGFDRKTGYWYEKKS